jgi:hypothetical protein
MAAAVAIRHSSKVPVSLGLCLILCLGSPCGLMAANHEALKADADQFFRDRVMPFVTTYCLPCHQNRRPTRGGVNFSPALKAPGHAAFTEQWKKADARVKAHDMPPKGAPQPDDADRWMFGDWLAKLKYLSDRDPGPFVIRRLTKTEYGNTLRDLFGVDPSFADGLPDEVSGQGYLNSLSSLQLEQYLTIADKVLRQIVAPQGARRTEIEKRLFGQTAAPGTHPREAARELARSIARKAYRRPPTEAELDVLVATFDLGRRNNLAYPQALHLMLKAVLVSSVPFHYAGWRSRVEQRIVPLDDHQLASRLSYLLWATMPDDELMTLADSGSCMSRRF